MSVLEGLGLPGRLGNPETKLYEDPRAHPKVLTALRSVGADGSLPNLLEGLSFEVLSSSEFMAQCDVGVVQMYNTVAIDLPGDEHEPKFEEITQSFTSFDGAQRAMHIFRPGNMEQNAPAVAYLHGGGMTFGPTSSRLHMRWCRSLAAHGVLAIAVDFRNAWTEAGYNPFPIGLNDCAAAVQYLHSHKDELGFGKLIVQGESGGANLAFATSLKAKKEGWIDQIDGIFGIVPMISNGYRWPIERKLKELPSLVENDGYFLSCSSLAGLGRYYAPNDEQEPLAWPYWASIDDCRGLPPHRIVVDELDPLRDEGIAYYRKLLAAGVPVLAHTNLGFTHASDVIFRQLLSEAYNKAINEIVDFAQHV